MPNFPPITESLFNEIHIILSMFSAIKLNTHQVCGTVGIFVIVIKLCDPELAPVHSKL